MVYCNFFEVLQTKAKQQPNTIGYEFIHSDNTEETITYAQLDLKARIIAGELQNRQLAGERALLLYLPGLDYVTSFLGCLYAGVTAVPAYPPDPSRLERTLPRLMAVVNDCKAKAILTTSVIKSLAENTFTLDKIGANSEWVATDEIAPDRHTNWKEPSIQSNDLAFLQYTSGSTASPRGVMLTHGNLLANMQLMDTILKNHYGKNPRVVSWLPPYHDMGLIGAILHPMYAGMPVTLMSPLDFLSHPLKWLKTISEKKGTASAGPNFAYDLCVRRIQPHERNQLDLSSWSLAVNGAEPIRHDALERFCEYFAPCGFRREAMIPSYGLAEATLYVSASLAENEKLYLYCDRAALRENKVKEVRPGLPDSQTLVSCGPSLCDVRIVHPDNLSLCPEGEVGEIWVMSDSVSQGYWDRESTNSSIFRAYTSDGEGPYLRTGDLGFLYKNCLFIAGRQKDVIIIRGKNHYPQDIEKTLEAAHPSIRLNCVAAFSVNHEEGESLAVVAEVKPHITTEELQTIAEQIDKAILKNHEIACETIALIPAKSIAKTSSGKIQRHMSKKMLADGTLETLYLWKKEEALLLNLKKASPAPTPPHPSHQSLEQIIASVLGVPAEKLDKEAPLVSYGLDSLMRQELLGRLEEWTQSTLPNLVIDEKTTAGDLKKHLGENHPQQDPPPPASASPQSKQIPPHHYQFELFPAYQQLKQQQQLMSAVGLRNPFFTPHEGVARDTIRVGKNELINYSNYNYLGLAGHPTISDAAKEAIDRYGTTVSASRLVSGERPLHQDLEKAIAQLLGVEDAIVYVSGHATNVSTIGHLFSQGDLIVYDSLSHNSLMQGIQLSGAKGIPFPHSDVKALAKILENNRYYYNRVLIAAEGIYSMDGDICPLPEYVSLKKHYKTFLMIDEAHSIGVLGKKGGGIGEHFGVSPSDVDLWMGTLSKSLAGCGGYIAGSKALVEYLRYSSPGFVFSVGISPPNTAASLAAIQLLQKEPHRITQLEKNGQLFLSLCKEKGLNTGFAEGTPIVPLMIGDSLKALQISEALFSKGVNAKPIIYPAVEERLARLRFFITAVHNEEQIRKTIDLIVEVTT